MNISIQDRRQFLKIATLAGSGIVTMSSAVSEAIAEGKEKKVEANEDLMREHGVLRRALLVYRAAAERLHSDPTTVPVDALVKTAKLFRTFGEDYHERKLEEKFIFPAVRKLKDPAASYPDVLETQHERGRKFTEYVLQVTQNNTIASNNVVPLAQALSAFDLMYEHHAAREDTIVFTAWKESLSEKAYKEMSEQFEHIEKQMFGHDGFEDAERQITAIESQFGISDISQFTITPPIVK